MPAMNTPPTTAFRRAYFQDMKSPVHVEITRARAVAPKNIFIGRGLGEGGADAGAGVFGTSGLGASSFGPSSFTVAGAAVFRDGRYKVPFLCNCER